MNPDRKVVELMKTMGSDVSKSRPVWFYFYFPDEDRAQTFARRLKGMQFKVETGPAATGDKWLCLAERNMVPDVDILEGLRKLLLPLANNLGGEYDGWETEMIV